MKYSFRLAVVLAVTLVGISFAMAQSPKECVFSLTAVGGTNPGDTAYLSFGSNVNATYCIDPSLGEGDAPPVPPAPVPFMAFWDDPRQNLAHHGPPYCDPLVGSIQPNDIRQFTDTTQIDTFEVEYTNADPDGGTSVTFYWWPADSITKRCSRLVLQDAATNGLLVNVDMASQNSYEVTNTFLTKFFIYVTHPKLVSAVRRQSGIVPTSYALQQNYPNPFNPTTTVAFDIAKNSFTDIAVYDVLGRKVATLASGQLSPGTYKAQWNGTDDRGFAASSGLYFVRLEAHGLDAGNTQVFSATRKLLLMK